MAEPAAAATREKLKAAAEAVVACEPGQGKQQAIQDAFQGRQRHVRAMPAAHRAVHAAMGAAVETANGRLSRAEQIKRFAILPVFWEPGGEEITPP